MKIKNQNPPRPPLLENVRRMLCEAEMKDAETGELSAGLRYHAACMIASGHRQISDLAGRFIKDGSREIDSIVSTTRTQTEWLLSEPMCSDLRKNGVNWSQLAEKPTTVFVIVPAHFLETQEGSVWLRLITMSALREFYGRAGRRAVKEIVFLLSEFPALKKLTAVEAARTRSASRMKAWASRLSRCEARTRKKIRSENDIRYARHSSVARHLRAARCGILRRSMRCGFRVCSGGMGIG